MNETNQLKMAVISGASHALKYKRAHSQASDEDVLRQITREMRSILEKIGQEE